MGNMDISGFLQALKENEDLKKSIVHEEIIQKLSPAYKDPASEIPGIMRSALKKAGIESLYSHQGEAIDEIERGCDVVIATETASGKSLTYNIPVVKSVLKDKNTTALYLFPLKALEQDQLSTLEDLFINVGIDKDRVAIYDGDTPAHKREKIRKNPPNILITNPDMIHLSILPFYKNWETFFKNLKYIVIDELHTYRGVFGSHIAQILRRLFRIFDQYGVNLR